MARTVCQAVKQGFVKQRGIRSIDWYKDDVPQYYCSGYLDAETDMPMNICQNCIDWVGRAGDDYYKWKEEKERSSI